MDPLPQSRRRDKHSRLDAQELVRQLHQTLGEPDRHAATDGDHLQGQALRNVRGRQKREHAIGGPDVENLGTHLHVRDQRLVRDQPHLRLARSARSEVQDGAVFGSDFRDDSREQFRIALHGRAALGSEVIQSQDARGRPFQQDRRQVVRELRIGSQRSEQRRVFDEQRLRVACPQFTRQFGDRVAGIKGRCDRAVGHDAKVGQAELGARLRGQPHDCTLPDTHAAQCHRDFAGCGSKLVPGIDAMGRPRNRLVERREIAATGGGLLEDRIHRT